MTGSHDIGAVLVTGAAGFIGSAVAALLADKGMHVVGCDNFNAYYSPGLKQARVRNLLAPRGVPCEPVELSDKAAVEEMFERVRPAYVVHLAAQAGVRYSLEDPDAYIRSNIVAFANVLEACRHRQPRHLVYASSSSVYGANRAVPFREDDDTDQPVSLYAATKKANEVLASCYSHLFGLRATGLRFFTVYGPWGRPDMAYFSFTEKIVRGETIPVFADGSLSRDFTYIADVTEAVGRILLLPAAETAMSRPHVTLNIGNHTPVTVTDFITTLERLLGMRARKVFLPMQAGDVPVTCADTTRLKEAIGFAPAIQLADGLSRFLDWYRGWKNDDTRTASPGDLAATRTLAAGIERRAH